MPTVSLDEDSVDEILYLARTNETSELSTFLTQLSTQTNHTQAALLAAAVDPETKNSALHYAAANGHTDIVKILLRLLADKATASNSTPASGLINAANEAGNTALHWAALNGHLDVVKALVQSGADVTIINQAGHDAVFEAEINDKSEVVDWLLGAVEELEKGIGKADGVSGDASAGPEDGADSAFATAGNASASTAENVTRQMEKLDTRDATGG